MLKEITSKLFQEVRQRHDKDGGDAINVKISEAFEHFHNNTCREDVLVKVAIVNTLYNTAIMFIPPVVKQINAVFAQEKNAQLKGHDLIPVVDEIASASWASTRSNKQVVRRNLSFASKFMHFQSKGDLPIYDSYVWILMVGYLRKAGKKKEFKEPASYREFFDNFHAFKETYHLSKYSNYDIDKFLWQYGKELIDDLAKTRGLTRAQAKATLKKNLPISIA